MSGSYLVCDQGMTYAEAQVLCESAGMRIARIDSAEENTWVAGLVMDPWLGGNSLVADDEWYWEDGELFWLGYFDGAAQNGSFTSWAGLNPSASPADADCARIDSGTGNWVDIFCLSSKPTVCELY